MTTKVELSIPLPARIDNGHNSINKLLEIEYVLKSYKFTKVSIDITNTSFFDASLCSLFMAMLRRVIEINGLNISIKATNENKVYDLFSRNGFFQTIKDKYDTIIPLKKFNNNENEFFLRYISEHIKENTNKFPFPKNLSDEIKTNLGEIFSNCEIHSKTDNVYVCGQCFPKLHEFSFCMTDTGIGIPSLIAEKKNIKDECRAIQWAFEEGNTTKIDKVGGLGLKRLKNNIKNRNGSLIIISNNIYYDAITDIARKLSFDFAGTSVIIRLNYK